MANPSECEDFWYMIVLAMMVISTEMQGPKGKFPGDIPLRWGKARAEVNFGKMDIFWRSVGDKIAKG
jgi:hypothetical protein